MNKRVKVIIAGIVTLLAFAMITAFKLKFPQSEHDAQYAIAYTVAIMGYGLCLAVIEKN